MTGNNERLICNDYSLCTVVCESDGRWPSTARPLPIRRPSDIHAAGPDPAARLRFGAPPEIVLVALREPPSCRGRGDMLRCAAGTRVLTIWECETRDVPLVQKRLRDFLLGGQEVADVHAS